MPDPWGLKLKSLAKWHPAGRQDSWNSNTPPHTHTTTTQTSISFFSQEGAPMIKPTALGGLHKHRSVLCWAAAAEVNHFTTEISVSYCKSPSRLKCFSLHWSSTELVLRILLSANSSYDKGNKSQMNQPVHPFTNVKATWTSRWSSGFMSLDEIL